MLAQAVLIIAVVTPFSFELHLGGILLGLVILSLFSVGVGALSFALAIVSEGQDWLFWTVQQTLIFPILLLAGVLLPVDESAPGLAAASSPTSTRWPTSSRPSARCSRAPSPPTPWRTARWQRSPWRRSAWSWACARCAAPADRRTWVVRDDRDPG